MPRKDAQRGLPDDRCGSHYRRPPFAPSGSSRNLQAMHDLQAGMFGVAELVVGENDTAIALGSGDVPVLATPRLIALCEQASVAVHTQ